MARYLASMRPRHYCPGERPAPAFRRTGCRCFNEAQALLPGRGGAQARRGGGDRLASMRPRHYCPGEPVPAQAPPHAGSNWASMRPRHYCPGEPASWWLSAAGRARCFNEAQALLPGRGPRSGPSRCPDVSVASMRPRHYCPGESPCRNPLKLNGNSASFRAGRERVEKCATASFLKLHDIKDPRVRSSTYRLASGSGVFDGTEPLESVSAVRLTTGRVSSTIFKTFRR
jgi:hypothetical protein